MKVKDLIKQLNDVDQEAYVGFTLWKGDDRPHTYFDSQSYRKIQTYKDKVLGIKVVAVGYADDCRGHEIETD